MPGKKSPPDRDVLVPKTNPTPHGIPAQTAPEAWSDDTGQTETGHDEDTPIGLEAQDAEANLRLRARVKETNLAVREVKDATATTHAGVETLRMETKRDVARVESRVVAMGGRIQSLDTKLDKVSDKVDEHGGVLLRMAGTLGEVKGSLVEIAKANDRRGDLEVRTHASRIDIDRVEKIAEINDEVEAKKERRAFWYRLGATTLKVLAAGGVVAATAIATHFAERC